jgi:hypothetical protein
MAQARASALAAGAELTLRFEPSLEKDSNRYGQIF